MVLSHTRFDLVAVYTLGGGADSCFPGAGVVKRRPAGAPLETSSSLASDASSQWARYGPQEPEALAEIVHSAHVALYSSVAPLFDGRGTVGDAFLFNVLRPAGAPFFHFFCIVSDVHQYGCPSGARSLQPLTIPLRRRGCGKGAVAPSRMHSLLSANPNATHRPCLDLGQPCVV